MTEIKETQTTVCLKGGKINVEFDEINTEDSGESINSEAVNDKLKAIKETLEDLPKYLADKLNEYISEKFGEKMTGWEHLGISYGIDCFFINCILNSLDIIKNDDESFNDFCNRKFYLLNRLLKRAEKENGFT